MTADISDILRFVFANIGKIRLIAHHPFADRISIGNAHLLYKRQTVEMINQV
ncbi:MAG TPA: hypothetical protein VMW76_03850 [Bacteroidales bacterium]|nr:hypothetical protein [Bacteroidales bacterium]